jgi:hypothetical protein
MGRVKVGRHKLDLYDGIDEMPIGRFHRFNRNLMVDAGVGSDLTAVDSHIVKAMAFMKAGKNDAAAGELENLRKAVLLIHEGLSPAFSAFACLVASVDGRSTEGWSESELDSLAEELKDLPVRELRSETGEVKKKIDAELALYFPSVFGNQRTAEWYQCLKRIGLNKLRELVEGIERREQVEADESKMLDMMAPRVFSGSAGVEVEYDREYENMSLAMTQQLHVDVKGMTVLEYYNAYEFLREQGKKMKSIRRG